MAASYPSAIKTFTDKTNKEDVYDAAHINALQDEVNAIETELGTDVAGTVADLKTRLAVAIHGDGAIAKGTSFPVSPAPIDGQPFYRTDEDTFYIYDGSTWEATAVLSDTLFQYAAVTTNAVHHAGSSLTPTGAAVNYHFLVDNSGADTYGTVWKTKWRKISGISTITIYAQIWNNGTGSSRTANLKVDVGGQNGNGTGTADQTSPEWINFTIDVSGLSNDTVYDVTVDLKASVNAERFMGNLIAFGS